MSAALVMLLVLPAQPNEAVGALTPPAATPAGEAPRADREPGATPQANPQPKETPRADREIEAQRTGLFGMGLGLELPMVGVVGGFGSSSDVGAGYTVGAALSYEVLPWLLVRAFGHWDSTRRARATVTYGRRGIRTGSSQAAEWTDFALGAGAAYLYRDLDPAFAPYGGLDIGITLLDGFVYRFDESLEDLTVDDAQTTQFDDGRLFGRGLGLIVSARVGVRLHLAEWLASMVELNVSYMRQDDDRIRNTLLGPDVRSLGENIWLIRGTFAVRIGL